MYSILSPLLHTTYVPPSGPTEPFPLAPWFWHSRLSPLSFMGRKIIPTNTVMQEPGGPGWPLAPPIFCRSVNPIRTGEGRLSPPITTITILSISPMLFFEQKLTCWSVCGVPPLSQSHSVDDITADWERPPPPSCTTTKVPLLSSYHIFQSELRLILSFTYSAQ